MRILLSLCVCYWTRASNHTRVRHHQLRASPPVNKSRLRREHWRKEMAFHVYQPHDDDGDDLLRDITRHHFMWEELKIKWKIILHSTDNVNMPPFLVYSLKARFGADEAAPTHFFSSLRHRQTCGEWSINIIIISIQVSPSQLLILNMSLEDFEKRK